MRQTVLRIQNLSKNFGGRTVLRDITVTIEAGEVILLQGENGSGKTTLLNILSGLLTPDSGQIFLGDDEDIGRPRSPTDQKSGKALRGRILQGSSTVRRQLNWLRSSGASRSWQDLRLFKTRTVEENLVTAIAAWDADVMTLLAKCSQIQALELEAKRSVRKLLRTFRIRHLLYQRADKLSLGEARRVSIARALVRQPQLLLLDEPVSGLDPAGKIAVVEMLRTVARKERSAIVIVEHPGNLEVLQELASTVWTLRGGGVESSKGKFGIRSMSEPPSMRTVRSNLKEERTLERRGRIAIGKSRFGPRGQPVLRLADVVVERDGRAIIGGSGGGVSLELGIGELAQIEAPNGWGKTTLLDAIAGLLSVSRGTIELSGWSVETLPAWERARRGISYNRARNFDFRSLRVREQLELSGIHTVPPPLEHLGDRLVGDLSGGELKRVGLVSALTRPRSSVILLDEPEAGLDSVGRDFLRGAIDAALGNACILVVQPLAVVIDEESPPSSRG